MSPEVGFTKENSCALEGAILEGTINKLFISVNVFFEKTILTVLLLPQPMCKQSEGLNRVWYNGTQRTRSGNGREPSH